MTDRVTLKNSAREHLGSARPSAFLVATVFLLVGFVLTFFMQRVPLMKLNLLGMQQEMEVLQENPGIVADSEAFAAWYGNALAANTIRATGTELLIHAALYLAQIIWAAGFAVYSLRVMRQGSGEWGNLLDGFALTWKLLLIELLSGLFITLGYMLFYFPGIVISYSLRQSMYVLIDHPDWSAWRCMGESRALMRGHRWELFVQDWSFAGWILLCIFPPVMIYVQPYMEFTRVGFYNALLAERDGAAGSWDSPDGQKPPWEY